MTGLLWKLHFREGIFGPRLFSRSVDIQDVELKLKAHVLNKMTEQGMPMGMMI